MYKIAILIAAAAAGTLAATSSFAGMNDERIEKRNEAWTVEQTDGTKIYQDKAPGTYARDEILPDRQDRHRVMG
jgi:hypothetical protein